MYMRTLRHARMSALRSSQGGSRMSDPPRMHGHDVHAAHGAHTHDSVRMCCIYIFTHTIIYL